MPSEACETRDPKDYNVESSPAYLRDDEAGFLSIVSPEPLRTYLEEYAQRGQLYEKLVRVIGSPGSGKTTMAMLIEARMVSAVVADPDKEDNRDIISALAACGMVERGMQVVAGVRLPMEGEYRDFWELPYARFFTVDCPPPALWNFDGAFS